MEGKNNIDREEEIHIESSTRKHLFVGIGLLAISCLLIALFIWALLIGAITDMDSDEFFYILITLGLGSLLLVSTVYGLFIKEHLIVNDDGITYVHPPARKHIPWSKLETVEFLGVNFPEEEHYGVLFSSGEKEINASSGFLKDDLRRLYRYLKSRQKILGFDIVDKQ